MKLPMKINLSKRVIALILSVLLILSAFNTYLILNQSNALNEATSINASFYSYVISQQDNTNYKLKNTLTNTADQGYTTASSALNTAFTKGNSVYLDSGNFTLADDVIISNKMNAKLVGEGATLNGNGKKIVIRGDNYTTSKYALISGLTITNATIRIENSFGTTITNMIFENCSTAVELANTDTWSEGTKIEDTHFINCTEGIAFRTPTGNATGSYASSEIKRCFFNQLDNSVGINVENLTEFSDSQLQGVRIWMGETGKTNQTGLKMAGSMYQTLLFGVVFESFTDTPNDLFAMDIMQTADALPIIDGGVSFLGNWTARIHNPYSKWISGVESVFDRENLPVPVGFNQFGSNVSIITAPLKISSFKPKIDVQGSFLQNETITVRIRLEFVDNVISKSVERLFSASSTIWLSDDEILQLFPSQNIIWAIVVDAKCSSGSTDAVVKISGYGAAG
jgi:hypothetical protein